jgi:hypothetical protein
LGGLAVEGEVAQQRNWGNDQTIKLNKSEVNKLDIPVQQVASKVVKLMAQKQEIEAAIREVKHSGEYVQVLHELVERAPGLISVQWRKVLNYGVLD